MPPLPPRPRVPPVVRRALVIAALAPACGPRAVRIGAVRIGAQPPRIGAEIVSCDFGGVVLDATGAPVPGVQVSVSLYTGDEPVVLVTDERGRFARPGSSNEPTMVATIQFPGRPPIERQLSCGGVTEIVLGPNIVPPRIGQAP